MNNTFVVSDESKNCYGQVILTDGIDTTQFEKNPVMLYMHERKTVVGRWENIRKDGKRLLADAVFDDSTELGATVKRQVEKGFLRSASIGVDILETRDVDGTETVTRCVLAEISIVDIPANSNALKLYSKYGRRLLRLAVPEQKEDDLRSTIIKVLGLSQDVQDDVIIFEIQRLASGPDATERQVDEAIREGYIEMPAKRDFVQMARVSPGAFGSYMKGEKRKRKELISNVIKEGMKARKVSFASKELFEEVGLCLGAEKLARILECIPRVPRLSEIISGGDKSGWTLTDYRHYAPDELRKNPRLYKRLLEEQEKKNGVKHTLEYYRKHDPGFLRDNPEIYEKLKEQEFKNK